MEIDRNGNKYKNTQMVTFNPPTLTAINDVIDRLFQWVLLGSHYHFFPPPRKSPSIDSDDDNDENENFYDNLGIRKGILLCKYVEF